MNGFINKFIATDKRTKMVQRNVIGNLFIKGVSIIISLIIIPLTLGYLNEYNYGIWVTLTSVIGWLTYFDIGINNGLRNKLTEALSQNDLELAKKYVSTTFALLLLIYGGLIIIFLGIYKFINWYAIFSLNASEIICLPQIITIIVIYICIRSILSTINIIFFASQKSAISAAIGTIEQFIILVSIFFLVKFTKGNLLYLCLTYCVSSTCILLIIALITFRYKFKKISPNLKKVDFRLKGQLFNLGIRFFIIQLAGLIQFQTVNFIILKYFGPDDVTAYNISYKYFNIIYMVWALLLAPIWSAITQAKSKGEYDWIKKITKKYERLFLLFLFGGLIMLFSSSLLYKLWLGDKISIIPFELSIVVFLYSLSLTFGSLYVQILNGLGALRIQYIASIISPFVFLLVSFLLIKIFKVGLISVIIASIIANFNGIFLAPYQYYLIIQNKRKNSVWTKLD